jgi:hypothetical protein
MAGNNAHIHRLPQKGHSRKRGRLNEHIPLACTTPIVKNDCVKFVSQHNGGLSISRWNIESQPTNLQQQMESHTDMLDTVNDASLILGGAEHMTMDIDNPFEETFDLGRKRKRTAGVHYHLL